MVSSTAVSTTALVRRAISSALPLRFNGSASISAAAHDNIASAAAVAASTVPVAAPEIAALHRAVPEARPGQLLARSAYGNGTSVAELN